MSSRGEPGLSLLGVRAGRVKSARALLRRGARKEHGRFLAEGPQAVREALARPGTVDDLFVSPDAAAHHPELLDAAYRTLIPVHLGDERALASLSDTSAPQGLVAVCRTIDVSLKDALERKPRLVALLAHARDPGNAGTILRSADAAGADLVVVTDASVDVYNPKCVRASAGSLFHVPVAVGMPAQTAIDDLRKAGLRVLAADGAGDSTLDEEIDTGRLAAPTAWLFGNEAWGLSDTHAAGAAATVRVPVYGRAESLNLAAAAAICLYASARAQRSTHEANGDIDETRIR